MVKRLIGDAREEHTNHVGDREHYCHHRQPRAHLRAKNQNAVHALGGSVHRTVGCAIGAKVHWKTGRNAVPIEIQQASRDQQYGEWPGQQPGKPGRVIGLRAQFDFRQLAIKRNGPRRQSPILPIKGRAAGSRDRQNQRRRQKVQHVRGSQ